MDLAPFAPFVPPQFGIKPATDGWERDASAALRRRVFCDEQQLFAGTDRDAIDAVAQTIVAVDYVMGMMHRVVGTVRIHEASNGIWYGSRLAIDPEYRTIYGLGSGLVHRAVSTAHARGCAAFFALVQAQNAPFFRRLGWQACEDVQAYGRAHVRMQADLTAYPAVVDEASVSVVHARRAS
jgi:putative N-acetyltransferase (TIGR04045 family)